jgi:putative hydrolase of the HAD superfamily
LERCAHYVPAIGRSGEPCSDRGRTFDAGARWLTSLCAVLRAVLLDLDETLIPEDEPLATAYLAVARAIHGGDAGDDEVAALRRGLRARWQQDAPCPDYRSRVHVSASDGLIAEFTGDDPALAAIRGYLPRFRAGAFGGPEPLALWQRTRLERQTTYAHAGDVLAHLRTHVRLALVTNGTSDLQRRKLALSGLTEHFDVVVASCDIGVGKPDPAIFATALEALGVAPDEAVMVGNDLDRDIAGATAAGIRSLWIQHGGNGRADLHDLRELPARLGL